MIIGSAVQQPADNIDYDIDCTTMFHDDGSDFLQTVVATVTPSGPTVTGVKKDNNTAKVWFQGGTDGTTYLVEVTMTSDQGRIKQDELEIVVEEFD